MARSKSQPRSKSQTRRSKSKTRKSISKSPGRNRKIQSPKSEPKKRSVSRGRPAKTPKRSVSPKKSKTQAKTPTKTPVIQRSASRSSSRSRVQTPKTPSVLSAPVSAIKRQSRSLVKKASEIPTKVQRLVLERSKSPKRAIGWCQGVTNNVCRKVQITYNGLRYRFNRACRYVKANQTDIFWTLVMLAFIGLLFYVFYYKGTKFDPAFKYVKDQYHRGSKYITTHYHNIRDHFYKK